MMALKGPGNTLKKNPYGDPTKASPYGKLPTKSVKKPKKEKSSDEPAGSSSNGAPGVALKEVFGVLADENGRITSAKLRSYVKELGLDFTDEEVKDMMQMVDPSGKGEVSYNNLLGVVRDFSHEFPTVKLTEEELTRELTSLTTITESSTQESNTDDIQEEARSSGGKNVDNIDQVEESVTVPDETQDSRPKSSRERIAEIAKRAIKDLDDKMSVIREDEELEAPDDVEREDKESGNSNRHSESENAENDKNINEGDKEENEEDEVFIDENDTTGADGKNKSDISKDETVNTSVSAEGKNSESEDATGSELETENECTDNMSTRASTVQEHRLDSAISTAVGRESISLKEERDIKEKRSNSRKRGTSQSSNRSRKGSIQKDNLRKTSMSKERSKSRPRKSEEEKPQVVAERRKSVPRRKFSGVDDPNFYSTMGCSLKLSQIRTRQKILYVMWRAVYDEAIRRAEQEKTKLKAKRRTSRT